MSRQDVPGRSVHNPSFATADHHAHLHPIAIPAAEPGAGELRLMTVRSEGQFNTVVYEEADRYRGQERRDVIMISRADRERLGLAIDQPVTVRSATGEMRGILVRELDVRAGNAVMYYPEANVLVPRAVDPASGTPSFKHVAIAIVA